MRHIKSTHKKEIEEFLKPASSGFTNEIGCQTDVFAIKIVNFFLYKVAIHTKPIRNNAIQEYKSGNYRILLKHKKVPVN